MKLYSPTFVHYSVYFSLLLLVIFIVFPALKTLAEENKPTLNMITQLAEQGDAENQYLLGRKYLLGDGLDKNQPKGCEWSLKAAKQGHAKGQNNTGICYHNEWGFPKDLKQAAYWYGKSADQGQEHGQYNLAQLYLTGEGVNKNPQKAFSLFLAAAKQGFAAAQYNVARLYKFGKGVAQDYKTAAKWYQLAAKQGDAYAQFYLGRLYENGKGVEQDIKRAVFLYHQAAEQGYAKAQTALGKYYASEGKYQDFKQAVQWYRKAAEQGYSIAQFNIGRLYEQGKGVEKSFKKAAMWYQKMAEQGDKTAQVKLGWLYEQGGYGIQLNYQKAVSWYKKAAEQGSVIAQLQLGILYQKGEGVEKDYEIAAQWYEKAANQDDHGAQYLLGALYRLDRMGKGEKDNHDISFKWFKKAAEGGDATSQNILAEMYLEGKGIQPDRKVAKQWFQKAALQGDNQAKRNLLQLERLQNVFLVINKNGHSGSIQDLVFSNDGKLLISASSDKTIDVWDVDSGMNIRTIAGEIGSGGDGQFTTIALSPNDTLLAAGGTFPGSKGDIRIFDIKTGELIKVLHGHTYSISDLIFSLDGKYLLSCSVDKTARLWKITTGELVNILTHDNSVKRGIFLQHGDIVVTAAGKNLYWWDMQSGELIRKIQAHDDTIYSLVLIQNGDMLSGGADSMVRLWDSHSGRKKNELKAFQPVYEMSVDELGKQLLFGRFDRVGTIPIKKGVPEFFLDKTPDSLFINTSAITPNGKRAAVGHGDGEIYFVNIDKEKMITELSEPVSSIKKVGFTRDGATLVWKQQNKIYGLQIKNDSGCYKVGDVVKEFHEQLTWATGKTEVNGWSITLPNKENDRIEIRQKEKLLNIIYASDAGGFDSFHDSQITPDGKTILTYNGGTIISVYDMTGGNRLWQRPFNATTGMIEDIAISPDSRFLVVGETDQTIKLYEVETGNLLLTLYFDGEKEWISWNPDGFYTGSLGGDQLISWHLNQGPDKAALRFPARQFSKQFYSPGQISATLSGKEQQTLAVQKITAGKKKKKIKSIEELIPPVVFFVEPTDLALTITAKKLRIRGKAVSKNSEPITDIWVLVNGRRAETARRVMPSQKSMKKLEGLSAKIDVTVNLPDGHTIISLIASNRYSQSAPLMFEVNKPDKFLQVQFDTAWDDKIKVKKPNLYMLAIGVSDYEQRDISLNFAHNDAEGVARAFSGQEGKLYGKVYERVLTNDKATRNNILDGLDWLISETTQEDITVLFIAGHGQKDLSGNYYFLPYDIDINALRRSGLRWDKFNDVLYKLPSKIILMADTCHSGSITGKTQGSNISSVLREIVGSEGGIVVMTASTGDEVSVERPDWGHGAFSKAVIEGLQGEAEGKPIDNMIDILELVSYINKRVKILTAGRQHATTEIPRVLPNFELIAL